MAVVTALAGPGSAPLRAQAGRDSSVVTTAGHGPPTYVLLSGVVGGVPGFRRLRERLVAHGARVVTIDPYRLSVDSADVSFAAMARRVAVLLERDGIDSARVVGHAHGAGVALRLAADHPRRVSALYFLDVGALAHNRTKVFSASLRLLPLITRVPGGRGLVRRRFIDGLRQNAGRQEWLDAPTQRAYAEPLLDHTFELVGMASRLAHAPEPEPLSAVLARVRVPVTVMLGGAPHPTAPDPAEVAALELLGQRLRIERLPGVGHFPHEEMPDEVAQYLLGMRQ